MDGSYDMFLGSVKSDSTREVYDDSMKRYVGYRKLEHPDMLLSLQNPRIIEDQIIKYVMYLRDNNIAYATIHFLVAPILSFYDLNNITLNKRKISKFYGERLRVVRDRGYTTTPLLRKPKKDKQVLQNLRSRKQS
jgi:hypothetical protein